MKKWHMAIFSYAYVQTCSQPFRLTTNTLYEPHWRRDEHAHDRHCMFSPRVLTLLGRTATHAWKTARAILAEWRGFIHISVTDNHLVPNLFNDVHSWIASWSVHDLHILFCCVGVELPWTYRKFRPNTTVAQGTMPNGEA